MRNMKILHEFECLVARVRATGLRAYFGDSRPCSMLPTHTMSNTDNIMFKGGSGSGNIDARLSDTSIQPQSLSSIS
jgi:hypothetical protein